MGRKKSSALKKRQRLGYYLCTISFNLPLLDLVDVVAVSLRHWQRDDCETLSRERVFQIANSFLCEVGQKGLKEAKKMAEDRSEVPDHIYDFALEECERLFPELLEDEEGDGNSAETGAQKGGQKRGERRGAEGRGAEGRGANSAEEAPKADKKGPKADAITEFGKQLLGQQNDA